MGNILAQLLTRPRNRRATSVSTDIGVIEDIGPHAAFELPSWNGEHPDADPNIADDQPSHGLPFHPLEGEIDPSQLDVDRLPLLGFKRKSGWFWL